MQSYESYRITAIGKEAYQTIKPKTDSRFGDNRIEVWKYGPELLAESGFVDKLSLYFNWAKPSHRFSPNDYLNKSNIVMVRLTAPLSIHIRLQMCILLHKD